MKKITDAELTRLLVTAWQAFYRPGMGGRESRAFQAGFRAGADAVKAQTEPGAEDDWAYRVVGDYYLYPDMETLRKDYPSENTKVSIERRRKAGLWEPVPPEKGQE